MSLEINDLDFGRYDFNTEIENLEPERRLSKELEGLLEDEANVKFASDESLGVTFGYDNKNTPNIDMDMSAEFFKNPIQAYSTYDGKIGSEHLERFLVNQVNEGSTIQDIKAKLEETFSSKTIQANKSFISKTLLSLFSERKLLSTAPAMVRPSEQTYFEGYAVGDSGRTDTTGQPNEKILTVAKHFMSELRSRGWVDRMENLFFSRYPTMNRKAFRKGLLAAVSEQMKDIVFGKSVFMSKSSALEAEYMPPKEVVGAVSDKISELGIPDTILDSLTYSVANTASSFFKSMDLKDRASKRISAGDADSNSQQASDFFFSAIGTDSQELSEVFSGESLRKSYMASTSAAAASANDDVYKQEGIKAAKLFLAGLKKAGWVKEVSAKHSLRFPSAKVNSFESGFSKVIFSNFEKYFNKKGVSASIQAVSKDYFPSREAMLIASQVMDNKELVQLHLENLAHIAAASVQDLFTQRTIETSKGSRFNREDIDVYTQTARQYFEDVPELDVDTTQTDSGFSMESSSFVDNNNKETSLILDDTFFTND